MNKLYFLRAFWCDIILVESKGHYALIDTGTADCFQRIDACMKDIGAKSLDFILITHFHRDHYGSLPALLDAYPVGTVYMKKFSGLNITTYSGRPATPAYNAEETELCEAMCRKASEVSKLVVIDGSLDHVSVGDFDFRLFGTTDAIREMYEDPASPYAGKISFGENFDSVALFADVDGTRVFLGGDAADEPLAYEKYSHRNTRYARAIGQPVDIFKVSHHGCGQIYSDEFLDILKPHYSVVTNYKASINSQFAENRDRLLASHPDAKLYCSDECGFCFTLGPAGEVAIEEYGRLPETTVEEIPVENIGEFFALHEKYLADDIGVSEEEMAWFTGKEYRDTIKDHMERDIDRHHLVWFVREGERIGAASYCPYTSEDGKCFILDFWVFPEKRSSGTGHFCYMALEACAKEQGAKYFMLNCDTEKGPGLWRALGFIDAGRDDRGLPLFKKENTDYRTLP